MDRPPAPGMVKLLVIASKLPGLALEEFFVRWREAHGAVMAEVPGIRRYVQNHGVAAGYQLGGQTHDGWSELWFDDVAAVRRAVASPAWQAVVDSGRELFAQPVGRVVARETVQKDAGPTTTGASAA